jgi:hypothetical protein
VSDFFSYSIQYLKNADRENSPTAATTVIALAIRLVVEYEDRGIFQQRERERENARSFVTNSSKSGFLFGHACPRREDGEGDGRCVSLLLSPRARVAISATAERVDKERTKVWKKKTRL